MILLLVPLALALTWRPEAAGSVDSTEGRVRCHYQLEEDLARCEQVAEWAEEAWAQQVERVGFNAPVPDGDLGGSSALDIYITRAAGGAGSAWVDCDGGDPNCIDADPDDDRATASSYVVIDPRTDDALFRSYVHHEFAHTLQYATDYTEPFLSLWEGTAVACEHWTDTAWATNPEDFGDYQATPWLSAILQDGYFLADIGYDPDSWYEYGAVAWVFFMDETYGDGVGSAGPAIWEAAAAPGATVLDAWGALSGDRRESLLQFTAERARMGTAGAPEWAVFAGDYGLATREDRPPPGETAPPEHPPYPLGVSFYDLPAGSFAVEFEGDAAVDWAVLEITDGSWSELDAGDRVVGEATVAVVNLGGPDFEASPELEPSSFGIAFTAMVPVEATDGCGCAHPHRNAGWLVIGVAIVAMRRYPLRGDDRC